MPAFLPVKRPRKMTPATASSLSRDGERSSLITSSASSTVRKVTSTYMRIISIVDILRFGDEAACTRRAKELAAKYKAELAKRETAAGTMVFEVRYGRSYVEVELAATAHQRLAAKTVSDW